MPPRAAGLKVRSSQSSPCSARWRALARGSGLLRCSLDPGCARRPSERVGARGVRPSLRSGVRLALRAASNKGRHGWRELWLPGREYLI